MRHIRRVGALRGVVSTDGTPAEQLVAEARALPHHERPGTGQPRDVAKSRTAGTKGSIELTALAVAGTNQARRAARKRVANGFAWSPTISASSRTFLRLLVDLHCDVTVVPAQHFRRGRAGDEAGRRIPLQRPRRSRAGHLCRGRYPQIARPRADIRHLPGPPALRPGAGRPHLQAEIRPPRLESSR